MVVFFWIKLDAYLVPKEIKAIAYFKLGEWLKSLDDLESAR